MSGLVFEFFNKICVLKVLYVIVGLHLMDIIIYSNGWDLGSVSSCIGPIEIIACIHFWTHVTILMDSVYNIY